MSTSREAIQKHMRESEYRKARAAIERRYPSNEGKLKASLTALRDQALAELMYRSGWTQEQLASEEKCARQQIARRVQFGQFLAFLENAPTGCKSTKPPKLWLHDLTERKFRGFWAKTDKQADSRFRFREVARIIEEHTSIRVHLPTGAGFADVVSKFADGKWHAIETIAHALKVDTDNDVQMQAFRNMLSDAKYRNARGHRWETRRHGKSVQYRILKQGKKKIDAALLHSELAPIIKGLEAEGKKNMATMTPSTVAYLTHQLKEVLKKLAQ